ncbi:MAG: hypothetical protein QOI83_3998 [Streptomycetaceae bacterium]|nr:hypothetical protein [Streptomycetaceae bacterium]
MAFDEVRYRREVLDKGLPLRDDLRWRYQLPHQLNGPAVAESVKEVRACWRRNRSRLKYRPVIDELRPVTWCTRRPSPPRPQVTWGRC